LGQLLYLFKGENADYKSKMSGIIKWLGQIDCLEARAGRLDIHEC